MESDRERENWESREECRGERKREREIKRERRGLSPLFIYIYLCYLFIFLHF